ncbi:glycosyl transferase family 1 [Candidatus Tenderia electrophaga]|jgi:glycosyltransferase involved in cell wall biosynthesis|uniref:Glycosyl transferase family 1 n=1 Tax=Candidatus Tenderia electrophaga TaxID=1748243 RepID=A0A0S2TDM2_9GAMM|nr:glycosyl transferase family 1 [Candidatus Tenderia electrophaga]
MRILVVTQYFWPENFRINDLIAELKQRGHELTVLTGKPNYPLGEVFPEFRRAPSLFSNYEGVEIFRVPMLRRARGSVRLILNYLSFVLGGSLWGPWFLRKREFDVVFIYEPSPVTVALPAILLGRIKKIPVVFWVLDLWPETLAAIGVVRSPRLLRWIGHLVQFSYNNCDIVLGQSRAFIDGIAKYCSDKSKIRYYPSWAEDVFLDNASEKANEIPVRGRTFDILFAGNIGEAQDMPSILSAAELLKHDDGVRWIIVGDGRKSEWLKAEVERRGLAEKVLLLGRYSVDRMPSFYAHADALLVSLMSDAVFSMTIPGKLQTYLMAGVPVLGMLDGEGASAIRQAKAGFTCPAGDANGLAAAVKQLAAMPESERRDMGLNGRRYAQREFDRDMLISKLEGFFEEAILSYRERETI